MGYTEYNYMCGFPFYDYNSYTEADVAGHGGGGDDDVQVCYKGKKKIIFYQRFS